MFPSKPPRFSLANRGAGESSYLMQTSLFDGLDKIPSVPTQMPAALPHFRGRDAMLLEHDGVVLLSADTSLRPKWKSATEDALMRLQPELRVGEEPLPFVRHFEDFKGHAIFHSALRLDIWPWHGICAGFDTYTSLIAEVTGLKTLVCKTVGLLTVGANCQEYGRWHRDASVLFELRYDEAENDKLNVQQTPNFYYTMFVPLDDLDPLTGNGGPEFILGSHVRGLDHYKDSKPVAMPACAGDVIVMNGKTIHRGTPNRSDKPRNMLYGVFAPPWFDEEIA